LRGKGQIDSVGISMLGGIPLGAFYGISVVRASPFWEWAERDREGQAR
jgi:hypothetical protein